MEQLWISVAADSNDGLAGVAAAAEGYFRAVAHFPIDGSGMDLRVTGRRYDCDEGLSWNYFNID